MRLGEKDGVYWDHLVSGAKAAIESDVPGPNLASPELLAWAKAHNVSAESAAAISAGLAVKVLLLADTRDRRAVPLLRHALLSPNHAIELYAADGLTQLQDKESIPLIIEACRKAPADVALGLATHSLLFFDDPRAQRATEAYVPKELLDRMRKEIKDGVYRR